MMSLVSSFGFVPKLSDNYSFSERLRLEKKVACLALAILPSIMIAIIYSMPAISLGISGVLILLFIKAIYKYKQAQDRLDALDALGHGHPFSTSFPDEEFDLEVLRIDPQNFKFLSEQRQADHEFIIKAIHVNPIIFRYLHEGAQSVKQIGDEVFKAFAEKKGITKWRMVHYEMLLTEIPEIYEHLRLFFKKKKNLALIAISANPNMYLQTPPELAGDQDILEIFNRHMAEQLQFNGSKDSLDAKLFKGYL